LRGLLFKCVYQRSCSICGYNKAIVALVSYHFDDGVQIWLADSIDFTTIKVVQFSDIFNKAASATHSLTSVTLDEADILASKTLQRVILIRTLPSYVLVPKVACGSSISFDEKWNNYVEETDPENATRKVSCTINTCTMRLS
jgi:hypothetical protein